MIPAFLLAGFTQDRHKDSYLVVSDLKEDRQWPSKPRNCGSERDFYATEKTGVPNDAFEQFLATTEDAAAPIIRDIVETRQIPNKDTTEFAKLMAFFGLLATRGPEPRSQASETVDQMTRHLLRQHPSTDEGFEDLRRLALREDTSPGGERKPAYQFELTRNSQLQMIVRSADLILPYLLARRWRLFVSDSGSFICSDQAVALSQARPLPRLCPLGYGHRDVDITAPLDRFTMLIGTYADVRQIVSLNRNQVAFYNTVRATQGQRFLFSHKEAFPWRDENGTVRLGLDGLSNLRATKPTLDVEQLLRDSSSDRVPDEERSRRIDLTRDFAE